MAELEQVLFARLDSQVALVAHRIYPVEAPQNPTVPYITYQRISEQVESGMTQDHGLTHPTIQVDCWGATYPSTRAVAAQVRAALKRWRDLASNPVVEDSFLERSTDMGRDPAEPEPRLYRHSSDWLIWHRE